MARIERHHSIIHAEKILREVKKLWPKEWSGWLRHWSNGREQGYYLQASMWNEKRSERCAAACVFSEGRSCDGALVMVGPTDEFDYQTSQPSDNVWENNRTYFYDTSGLKQMWSKELEGRGDKLAAKHIIKELRRFMREDLKKFREQIKKNKKFREQSKKNKKSA